MSFCPSKDIHSVYLDNELPDAYVKEYEAHIASCKECSTELEKLKKIRALLKTKEVTPCDNFSDEKFMDESFERLQIRMNYAKTTKNVYKADFSSVIKYSVPAMAAAAVFAVVLPIGFRTKTGPATVETPAANVAVAETQVSAPVNVVSSSVTPAQPGIISGNISQNIVSNQLIQPVSSSKRKQNMIEDVDVFRPNFDNENSISIKITVPGFNSVTFFTENSAPAE